MTVLEHDPVPCFLSFLNHFFCDWSLSLTQRNWLNILFLGLSEGTKRCKWIWSWTENKDKRRNWWGITIDLCKIERRRSYKLLSKFTNNVILNSWNHLIRPNGSKNHEFLEVSESFLNILWHFFILRFFRIINFFPIGDVSHNAFNK